jgi:hypothetical protein
MILPPAYPEDQQFQDLLINRGGPVTVGIQLVQPDGTPYDLSNLEPFKCQVRRNPEGAHLLDLTVTLDEDPTTGKLTLSALNTATTNLPECNPTWDLIDRSGYVWVSGVAKIRKKNSHF